MKKEESVNITLEEYKQLKQDSLKLEALEGAGVDNWEGYDDAMEMMEDVEDYL